MFKRFPLSFLAELPRPVKKALVILTDMTCCVVAMVIALYLRLGFIPEVTRPLLLATGMSIFLCVPIFWGIHIYRAVFRHVGPLSILTIGRGIVLFAIPYAGLFTLYGIPGVPRTIGLLQPVILFLLVIGSRALTVQLFRLSENGSAPAAKPNVLIYGAGSAGRQLASALRQGGQMELRGYIDDSSNLVGQTVDGRPVFSRESVAADVARLGISHILLAMPSASRRRRNEIIESLTSLPVKIQTLPGMIDLVHGRVHVSDLHDVDIEDLLGRGRVVPDPRLLVRNIRGETVMVTGAGGSIGSELCRQIIASDPAHLLLFEQSEYSLYSVHQELASALAKSGQKTNLVPLLGSVEDEARVESILGEWRPLTVFHAAAYKHVPLVEYNPVEGVRNNIFGTYCMALAARRHMVANFVLISTDKAVRPTSIMGMTKRLAEQVLQALAAEDGATRFSMVRFGNVLGSSGSVVPLFRNQIREGGPLTITHADMTRYFMLIPEAAQLVIQAGAMAEGGEVFLLDMGDPVRIMDLARKMIAFSGLSVRDASNPDGEIDILEIGLRPGEKLYEELLIAGDTVSTTHPLIMKANESFVPWSELDARLKALREALKRQDGDATLRMLKELVPEYIESHVGAPEGGEDGPGTRTRK